MVKEEKKIRQIKVDKQTELDKLQKLENKRIQNLKLPWIPEDIQTKMRNMSGEQEKMTTDFIKEIQTHPDHKNGKKHRQMELLIAADRGYQLGSQIIEVFKDQKAVQNKYRLLIFALYKNPAFCIMLIENELKVEKLIHMDEKSMRSDELKKK